MHIYPAVKNLLFINVFIFLMQKLVFGKEFTELFALGYNHIISDKRVWGLLTYAFLHGSFFHLFFNMLIFFFIANEIEAVWGSKKFLQFYLLSAIGAGLIIFGTSAAQIFFFDDYSTAESLTLGASGAIFALLLAYSFLFGNKNITLLLFFIIPVNIRGKYLVWVSLLFTIMFAPFSGSNISHSGHIGGIVSGLLFLAIFGRRQPYYFAYNEMLLFFREIFSIFKPNKLKKIEIPRRNSFFDIKHGESSDLDENNMSEQEIEEQIDYLLDKISEKGLRGLSPQEKNFLNRISALYHHKFP